MPVESKEQAIRFRNLHLGDYLTQYNDRVTGVYIGALHAEVILEKGGRVNATPDSIALVIRKDDPIADLRARVEALERRPVYSVVAGITSDEAVLNARGVASASGVRSANGDPPVVPSVVYTPESRCDAEGPHGFRCSLLRGHLHLHLHRHKAHEGHDVNTRCSAEWVASVWPDKAEEADPELDSAGAERAAIVSWLLDLADGYEGFEDVLQTAAHDIEDGAHHTDGPTPAEAPDPNAIGEWQRTADGWRRLFLNRPGWVGRPGAPAAYEHAERFRVWFDSIGDFVVVDYRAEADALLLRLYPPAKP